MLFTQHTRHRLLQKLFWNPIGASLVRRFIRFQVLFNVVVRNYSLIGHSNGERWLLTLLDESPLSFDVGSYDGQSTAEILNARPRATVIGFDPSNFGRESYQERFRDDSRVRFVNAGFSDRIGQSTFYDYQNMCKSLAIRKEVNSGKLTAYEVHIDKIDDFSKANNIPSINFLKIDAEGFDLNVLEGASEMLTRQAIDIFTFEFASGWTASKRYLWEVDAFLKEKPYRLFRLFNGFLCPFIYHHDVDSCTILSTMYVGVSEKRFAKGDIPVKDYGF
jgi:FkbM family methyltransferase